MTERHIPVEDGQEQRLLFGSMDRNLRAIRERFGVAVTARRGTLRVAGDDDDAVREVTRRIHVALARARERGEPPSDAEVFSMLVDDPGAAGETDGEETPAGTPSPRPFDPAQARSGGRRPPAPMPEGGRRGGDPFGGPRRGPNFGHSPRAMPDVKPMTPNQAAYVAAIRSNDVVLAIGPAGTGKTYLAVSEAVASLRSGRHRKLILTRPAVEAGEKLGFLPGDFHAKINPYLRPLYDALEEMLRFGEVQRYVDADVIEIVPLAYMRGRTLKGAFIILDEAQNTTPAQMKMFLTRLGADSKIVVTGDATQVDLPDGTTSGLAEAREVLRGVSGLAIVEFGGQDIIRHPMVQRIVDAYERRDAAKRRPDGDAPPAP
jgi:phosphate starvation-inducible PhoH-like protein